jgi:membrane protease YdiL (CAAX protease family)
MSCIPRSFVAEDADKALEALVGEDVAVPRQRAGDLRIERGVDRAVETNHRCQQRMQMKVEGVDSATEGGQEGNGSHNAYEGRRWFDRANRESDQVSGTGPDVRTLCPRSRAMGHSALAELQAATFRARRSQRRGAFIQTRADDPSGAAGADAASAPAANPGLDEADSLSDQTAPGGSVEPENSSAPSRESDALSRLLRLDTNPLWRVPWGVNTVIGVLSWWYFSFRLVGSRLVPLVASALGLSSPSSAYASFLSCALYALLADALELAVVLAILFQALRSHSPLQHGWFPIRPSVHLLPDYIGACATLPVVSCLCLVNEELCAASSSVRNAVVAPHTWEQGVITPDPLANAVYLCVFIALAPLWEELLFRGFLLPSLTKHMPVDASIALSSLVFAFVHSKADQLMPLWLLGAVLGVVFIRTRNLLAPIAVHATWNVLAFIELV